MGVCRGERRKKWNLLYCFGVTVWDMAMALRGLFHRDLMLRLGGDGIGGMLCSFVVRGVAI